MLSVEWGEGIRDVARDEWDRLVGDESPFLEWDWLASLEDAGVVGAERGWLPRPLLAREAGRLIAACPVYVKAHSEGEFVFDFAWAEAAARAGIRYYPKLLVGVPFTPVTGARFLIARGVERAALIARLGAALREACVNGDLSGVHVNFCREDEVAALAGAAGAAGCNGDIGIAGDSSDVGDERSRGSAHAHADGYLPRIGFQYHWHNAGYRSFGDYLARFRSKRRNQIQRERRELEREGIAVEVLTGDRIGDELFEPMFACYLATIESRYWGRQYLNARFFELLRDRFRHRLCFAVARRRGALIAGTANVIKGDALYGRYWGALERVRYLHFNVCYYAAIEHCIANGIARFEPGAGGDYKFLRGFDPQPTYSLHFLAEPRLARAVAAYLARERAEARGAIAELRSHSALREAL